MISRNINDMNNNVITIVANILFTPEFGRRISGIRRLPELCQSRSRWSKD